MRTNICQCGARLHFENSFCFTCQDEVGFLPDARRLSTIKAMPDNRWHALTNNEVYRKCKNYSEHDVCNWMIPESDLHAYCFSCRLSEIIPDISKPDNFERWRRIERAKRRLIYSLLWLELPIVTKEQDPQRGLAFHLMEDQGYSEFGRERPMTEVVTGHSSGTITLNIAEADPAMREKMRADMSERYRTLLGHFRHESGHYYWDQLVRNSSRIDEFRAIFGDERWEYGPTLQAYYANGPVANWEATWISAYASSHPWEDWAETWAHYLHIVDSLETASDYGFDIAGTANDFADRQQFSAEYLSVISVDDLVHEWSNLSVALNDMNRSMGLADAYPFILSSTITDKLEFVHALVTEKLSH